LPSFKQLSPPLRMANSPDRARGKEIAIPEGWEVTWPHLPRVTGGRLLTLMALARTKQGAASKSAFAFNASASLELTPAATILHTALRRGRGPSRDDARPDPVNYLHSTISALPPPHAEGRLEGLQKGAGRTERL
jgi:hypothetical protein